MLYHLLQHYALYSESVLGESYVSGLIKIIMQLYSLVSLIRECESDSKK